MCSRSISVQVSDLDGLLHMARQLQERVRHSGRAGRQVMFAEQARRPYRIWRSPKQRASLQGEHCLSESRGPIVAQLQAREAPLYGMQIPHVLKIRDGLLELLHLAFLAQHEDVQVLLADVFLHHCGAFQLAQCVAQVGRQ